MPPAKNTAKNTNLHSAKREKNDEFYTQLSDIENELKHYSTHFSGKTVLCNCDDPRVSAFFRYFYLNFCYLGLKKLIAVCYKNLNPDLFSQNKDEQAVYCIYDGMGRKDDRTTVPIDEFIKKNEWGILKGDGDFRSDECIELLKQADVVCTNPPFSLFREYVAQLMEYNKKFIIIGNKNAITYKEIFFLIKEDKMWCGCTAFSGGLWFHVPTDYDGYVKDIDEIKLGNVPAIWLTNLDHMKRHEELVLVKRYTPKDYPKYDNYDAIEVGKTVEIPMDYDGVIGVPISFLDKYNPKQFEIVGQTHSGDNSPEVEALRTCPQRRHRGILPGTTKEIYARILIRKRTSEPQP